MKEFEKEISLKGLLKNGFGITADLIPMAGYGSLNFRLSDQKGQKFVLKLEPDLTQAPILEAENAVLLFLQQHQASLPAETPTPLPDLKGQTLVQWALPEPNGTTQSVLARVLSFVPGTFVAEAAQTPALFQSLGQFLGQLNQLMAPLRSPEIERRSMVWDLQYCLEAEQHLPLIASPAQRSIAAYFLQQFREQIQPILSTLPKGLLYNDANDWNVLTSAGKVSGIIDFGDMCYGPRIFEVAVALAYACMHKTDPLPTVRALVSGYHRTYPLLEAELKPLYYLVAARLATSVCMSARSKKLYPDNPYITVSEAPAWTLLHQWLQLNPFSFHQELLRACQFPLPPTPETTPLLNKRKQFFSKGMKLSYQEPLLLERGALQYLYDRRGQTYLDAYNNVIQVGHCHPHVVRAAQSQIGQLNTNTRYLYPALTEYAEQLLAHFPPPLSRVFFVNSGSAATDLALRIVRLATGSSQLLALDHGYHGNTQAGIEASAYKFNGKGGTGPASFVHLAPLPDLYRNPTELPSLLAETAEKLALVPAGPINLIAEPVVGCGGQVFLPPGYLAELFSMVRQRGGLCIIDEVQTGFGRLGEFFWGFEQQKVLPDLVVLGKPIGNGHPLGAVVCTESVAQAFENGMEFFSSFGGNPVSCAVGKAVLEVLNQEQLPQRAAKTGQYLWPKLESLATVFPQIGAVRGMGLFGGIEFVQDAATKSPHPQLAHQLVEALRQDGILLGTDGPFNNVIKIKPPLCFDQANAERFVTRLEANLNRFT